MQGYQNGTLIFGNSPYRSCLIALIKILFMARAVHKDEDSGVLDQELSNWGLG